jgi:hypothetical protein
MIPVVVVYKEKRKRKVTIQVIEAKVDDILDTNKRKPLVPNDAEILEIGVGEGFLEKYKKKHKNHIIK